MIQFFSETVAMDAGDTDDAVTELLRRWVDGDTPAGDRLFTRVYEELRVVARRQRQHWNGEDTLNTTALVHEVFLRMNGAGAIAVHDRAHFYALAARATRQILSNYARRGHTQKRGSGSAPLNFTEALAVPTINTPDDTLDRLWALEMALQHLQRVYPRPCSVVECRYFGGLSIPETALALGISEATVKRDWALAQAWLYRALREHAPYHD
ncbi:MAG: ECF-type sigma factor [Gemmatimonadaceae bacterium]